MSHCVLTVGHCPADHASLTRLLAQIGPCQMLQAGTPEQALQQLQQHPVDLVLVNRVFDARGESGLDLIRQLTSQDGAQQLPVMLVSNFADAQQEAVAAGALPGFGKSALAQPETLQRVRQALNHSAAR